MAQCEIEFSSQISCVSILCLCRVFIFMAWLGVCAILPSNSLRGYGGLTCTCVSLNYGVLMFAIDRLLLGACVSVLLRAII